MTTEVELHYIRDADGSVRTTADVHEWAEWMRTGERFIRQEYVGEAWVSTVFLTNDHSFGLGPPVLWETMIFGGEDDQSMWRYTSEQAAIEGHERIVEALREGRDPDSD
jgi:hypothetical protein